MRPKYPHLLFSFLFFFLKNSRLIHDFFETYSCVSRLNSSLFGTYSVRPPLMATVTIRRRRRLTPEIVGSGRLNDVEFISAIGFVRFATDRHRLDDEDSRRFGFCFVSLSTQLENENEHFGYNDWHSTNVFPVALLVNSLVSGGTSIEAPSMEVLEKGRRR